MYNNIFFNFLIGIFLKKFNVLNNVNKYISKFIIMFIVIIDGRKYILCLVIVKYILL